jgi:hypothetical protein
MFSMCNLEHLGAIFRIVFSDGAMDGLGWFRPLGLGEKSCVRS